MTNPIKYHNPPIVKVKLTLIFILLLCCTGTLLHAQSYAYGSVVDANTKAIKNLNAYSLGADGPPDAYSLKQYCPTPGNQGQVGSCTAWALGYGILTMKYAIENSITTKYTIDNNTFSSMYIFNDIKNTNCPIGSADMCNACGSNFFDGLNFLKRNGDVYHKRYNDDLTCFRYSVNSDDKGDLKIVSGATVFNENYSADDKIERVIEQIYNQNPVFLSVDLPQSYGDHTYFEDPYFPNGVWTPPAGAVPNYHFAHALTIVGYDRNSQTFEILNSWGTKWANKGFCYMSFNDFIKYATYGGVVFTEHKVVSSSYKTLELSLEKYKRVQGTVHPDANLDVSFNSDHYEANAPQGQLFKVNFTRLPDAYYAYIMSYDANGKAQIHFPLNNENPYIYNNNLSLVLPKQSVLVFNQVSDRIVIVLSKHEINNLKERFESTVLKSGDLLTNLNTAFDAGQGQSQLRYDDGKIKISIPDNFSQSIVLLVNLKQN